MHRNVTFRRAVLMMFVNRELLDIETAQGGEQGAGSGASDD